MLLHKVVPVASRDSGCKIEHPDLVAINAQCLPKTWAPMSEDDFAKSLFFSCHPDIVGSAQIVNGKNGKTLSKMVEIHFVWFDSDETGIAFERDYWEGKVRYFRFGCDHDFHEVYDGMIGACLHTWECSKCGARHTVDSSD